MWNPDRPRQWPDPAHDPFNEGSKAERLDRVPSLRDDVFLVWRVRGKQMRISKGEIVAGHPALQVRRFLRRFDGMFFMRCAVERVMQLKPEQTEEFIHEMVALKLIEPTATFNNEAAYEVGDLGLAIANATATKPIYRETAERVLKEFMERVDAVNASKEYAFRIRGVALFGSMLSSADRVGDVDVAVDLQPSISDPRRFKRLWNPFLRKTKSRRALR